MFSSVPMPHHWISLSPYASKRVCNSWLWSSVSFPLYIFHFGPSMSLTCALLGASDTGCTTFVNTLCKSEVLSHKISDSPKTAHVEEGIRIKPVNVGALQPQTWFFGAHLLPF